MDKKHIDKMAEDALSGFDGAGRATPKPYLITRIKARMEKQKEDAMGKSGSFILKPAFVIAGLCFVIGINAIVMAYNNNTPDDIESFAVNEQVSSADEFGTTIATLYDIENNEP